MTPPCLFFHQCLRCLNSLCQSNYSDVKDVASTNTSPSEKEFLFLPKLLHKMKLLLGLQSPFEIVNFLCMDYALWTQNVFEFLWFGTVVSLQVFIFSAVLELGDTTDTYVCTVCTHGWPSLFVDLSEELEECSFPAVGTQHPLGYLDRPASTTVPHTDHQCHL